MFFHRYFVKLKFEFFYLGIFTLWSIGECGMSTEPTDLFSSSDLRLWKTYCYQCHANGLSEGEVDLGGMFNPDAVRNQRTTWTKVREVVAFGAMPPDDAKRPSPTERKKMVRYVDKLLSTFPSVVEQTPPLAARRLNRAEYNNTLRDLLGVDLRPADDFPSDEVGDGFDNNARVLTLPTLLMEKYFDAAEKLADAVIITPAERKEMEVDQSIGSDSLTSSGSVTRDSFFRHQLQAGGSVKATFQVPATGRYRLSVSLQRELTSRFEGCLEITDEKNRSLLDFPVDKQTQDRPTTEVDFSRGPVTIIAKLSDSATLIKETKGDSRGRKPDIPSVVINSLKLEGPLTWTEEMLPEHHRQIVVAYPQGAFKGRNGDEDAARVVLRQLTRRAFRGPVEEIDLDRYVAIVTDALSRGKEYEEGLEIAVTAVLVSPRFLFRVESSRSSDLRAPLDSFQLASRLSYFLWSTMPDDRLLALAEDESLLEAQVLRAEVSRMIADQRSAALFDGFAAQWLGLRNLESANPDTTLFPGFDDSLRRDMLQETRWLFLETLRGGKSVLNLLDAKSTFLNQRLAEFYGISEVVGPQFREVSLQDSRRTGILGHASVLTLTSNPGRTSPVKRGKWVMENLLGTPPPDPPPNVQTLEESAQSVSHLPLRNQLQVHRANPACAACHRYMDAIGFGLENFDAIGRWREQDQGQPIDPSGELPSGDKFSGPIELADRLRGSFGEDFATLVVNRLLTYALGRGLETSEQASVEEIIRAAKEGDFKLDTLISEVVLSPPFRLTFLTKTK
jgi:hypothetical protein